jgi:hypothetical protein
MSKRMNIRVEEEEKKMVGKEELMRVLDEVGDVSGRGNGVVERIRGYVRDVLEVKGEVSVGYMNKVVNKLEGRDVEYSVVRYSVMKMEDVEMYKKGRNNWIRKV